MKNRAQIAKSFAMVTQLSISILAPVVLCVFIGTWLDERFGWSTTVVLLLLGIAAGARNGWLLIAEAGGIRKTKKSGKNEPEEAGKRRGSL